LEEKEEKGGVLNPKGKIYTKKKKAKNTGVKNTKHFFPSCQLLPPKLNHFFSLLIQKNFEQRGKKEVKKKNQICFLQKEKQFFGIVYIYALKWW
jgi:hypothetical protein